MRFKYFFGAVIAEAYRFLRVFPNSDPIMGFVVPAAKNEAWWKGPLFAFATMFAFDFFTSGIGIWTIATASTYALVALSLHYWLKGKASSIRSFLSAGAYGVLAFDFVTGPIMSTFLFRQEFFLTIAMQIPFTVMHLVSASFAILIIAPIYDRQIAKEMSLHLNTAKTFLESHLAALGLLK